MVFTYPALLWFLPLLGLVVLIHVINMFRHRRVEWAALEFLLASYRKSRVRILLRQLLLMLLRIAALGTVILMLAGPKLEGPWVDLLLVKPTHHVILLDDSFSMNDSDAARGGASLFEDALGVVRRIVDGAAKRKSGDRLTLVRLSETSAIEAGAEPEVSELSFDELGLRTLEDAFSSLRPSQGAERPEKLLFAAETIFRRSSTRLKPVAYFISDFRQRDWANAAPVLKQLETLRELGAAVRMVRAVDDEHPNLGIADLRLVDGIHAADIDMILDATIVNHSSEDADNVHLTVWVDDRPQPSLTLPKVKSGERTVPPVRFSVRVDGPGAHRIELRLQPDAIPDDNRRFLAVEVPAALEILLIASDKRTVGSGAASQYVRVALAPGGTKSGIRTRVETPAFLTGNPLKSFDAVFLLEVPVLETSSLQALERYVAEGGGLALFFGAESRVSDQAERFRAEWYKNGEGLLPFAPVGEKSLEPDFLSRMPDLAVWGAHPIFRLFGDGESPLLSSVRIEHYVSVEPESTRGTVLASLRNGAPLVLEKGFGQGRVVAFLTSASPTWNNWGRGNPSFVVVLLELAAWLSKRAHEQRELFVGDEIPLEIDTETFESNVRLHLPPRNEESDGAHTTGDAVAESDGVARIRFSDTDHSGFYTAILKEHSGNDVTRLFALNVDADEGRTATVDLSELSEPLRSVKASLESAAGFSMSFDFAGERPWNDALLCVVLLILIGETFLAGRILPPKYTAAEIYCRTALKGTSC